MLPAAASVLFTLALVFFFWSMAGYPMLLYVVRRLRPMRPSAPGRRAALPTVTVLLPVADGERWVRAKLESILGLDYPREAVNVLVASDGSTDDTDAIVTEFAAAGENVELVRLPKGGKARALNALIPRATGDIVFFVDVRQKLNRECLSALAERFSDPAVGAACGELIILDGETEEEQSVGLYWKVEKWIRRQMSAMGTLLVVTGCVYAIRRELAEPLPDDALGDDIFMPQAILRKGYRVVFEEKAKAFDHPTARDVEFRRKVRTLAGLYQYIGRHGLGPYPLHFFSYKVSRLLLPWCLLLMAVSSFFLPQPLASLAVAGQALFYLAAVADPVVPPGLLKRVSSAARTFCMLMLASLFSASILFRSPAEMWTPTTVRSPQSHTGDHLR